MAPGPDLLTTSCAKTTSLFPYLMAYLDYLDCFFVLSHRRCPEHDRTAKFLFTYGASCVIVRSPLDTS